MVNPVLDQERVAFIKARIGTAKRFGVLSAWPRTVKELHLVDLEVDWVRFSTLNHRTKAEQLREMKLRCQRDFFSSDPMGDAAQSAQYEILKAQDGFKALKEDLAKRRQQDPAVVTADGVLINGNRRAAALRSLHKEVNHPDSRYVRCLVLPDDATAEEIVDLETELQIARDFKEDYSWVNEAMLIEELYDREGKDFARVAAKMHRDVQDIKAQYEKIQQLNQLVDLSGGARLHIDFKENESAFEELAKHIRNKPREEAESVRVAYFLGTLTGVNYRDLRRLRRRDASELIQKEAVRDPALLELLNYASDQAFRNDEAGGVLDDLLGGSASAGDGMIDVLSLLAKKKSEEELTLRNGGSVIVKELFDTLKGKIENAAHEAKEEERDQEAVSAPIVRLEIAIDNVNRARRALGKAKSFSSWPEAGFREKCAELRSALQALESGD